MPGFVDAHHHLSVEALHPIWVDLSGATDAEAIVDRLRRAAELPGTGWIRGCQWDLTATSAPLGPHLGGEPILERLSW